MWSRLFLPRAFRLTYLGSTLTSVPSLVLSRTMSTGIRQYFTVVEREEWDLPSSKHSRLDEGEHDDSDGSIIAAEEDINCLMNVLFQHNVQTKLPPHSKSWADPCSPLIGYVVPVGSRREAFTGARLVSMWLYHLCVIKPYRCRMSVILIEPPANFSSRSCLYCATVYLHCVCTLYCGITCT